MGRRLCILIGTVFAVAELAAMSWARPEDPSSLPVPAAIPAPAEVAEAPAMPAPKELPAGFADPGEKPGNLGPEVPTVGAKPEGGQASPAIPAPNKPRAVISGIQKWGSGAAPRDDAVKPTQAVPTPVKPPEDGRTLPGAEVIPGQPGPVTSPNDGDPEFVLPAERLPIGRQAIGLTVDVLAPQVMNLGQPAALRIVVRNTGTSDAIGVTVRDQLPDGLAFESSQPEARQAGSFLAWSLGTIAAGAERAITVNVKPTKIGSIDHSATVTIKAGGRSRTMVHEPKLKVELTAPSNRQILRGQPVEFKIAVTNIGDGPARRVVVQARLSTGLRHESGVPNEQNLFEQPPIELIKPGERLVLSSLIADALQGGNQSCTVLVQSPDVVPGAEDAKATAEITVVEPKLAMKLIGPDKRFTDTIAKYEIALENPGTAPARNVRVQATVPSSGRLYALPTGAEWDQQNRRLSWTRPQLDPGEKAVLAFEVRMGGIGLYQVAVETRADTGLLAKETLSTDVAGLADLFIEVIENRRAIDVGDVTIYRIKITNKGTKEATGLNVSANLTETVEPEEIYGTSDPGKWGKLPDPAKPGSQYVSAIFPQIPRLGPNKMIELGIRVKAVKAGPAICRVFLTHDDAAEEKLEDLAVFKITPVRR